MCSRHCARFKRAIKRARLSNKKPPSAKTKRQPCEPCMPCVPCTLKHPPKCQPHQQPGLESTRESNASQFECHSFTARFGSDGRDILLPPLPPLPPLPFLGVTVRVYPASSSGRLDQGHRTAFGALAVLNLAKLKPLSTSMRQLVPHASPLRTGSERLPFGPDHRPSPFVCSSESNLTKLSLSLALPELERGLHRGPPRKLRLSHMGQHKLLLSIYCTVRRNQHQALQLSFCRYGG